MEANTPQRVIFLDFDGVLLSLRTKIASNTPWAQAAPDPILCAVLTQCDKLSKGSVKIVVSSSWRENERICKRKLAEGCLLAFLHKDWATPIFPSSPTDDPFLSRPKEIADWLARHPEVTDYRILDDDEFLWTDEQKSRFLLCHPYDGVGGKTLYDLIEWAGDPNYKGGKLPTNIQANNA